MNYLKVHRKEEGHMKKDIQYPFLMIEISTDTDPGSEHYKEKYISVSCIKYKDGRPYTDKTFTADRFVIEHHTLNLNDQIKPSKHNLQKLDSQDFEDLGSE
tara:strand:+ start:143 stop:445 length:303 start_codon:yes stop_codon:yes gene_type:complete